MATFIRIWLCSQRSATLFDAMSNNMSPQSQELGQSEPLSTVDSSPIPRKPLPSRSRATSEPGHHSELSGSDQYVEIKEPPALPSRGWRFYGAFGTLCLCTFIIALDSTIICVALPVSFLGPGPDPYSPPYIKLWVVHKAISHVLSSCGSLANTTVTRLLPKSSMPLPSKLSGAAPVFSYLRRSCSLLSPRYHISSDVNPHCSPP